MRDHSQEERCPACDGRGANRSTELNFDGDRQPDCRVCNGTGKITVERHERLEQNGISS